MPPTIKPGTITNETLTLQRDLVNGLKITELARWSEDSEVRQLLLQNLLFGRIRWLKSNGRPLSTTLNQAFTIFHWTYIIYVAQSQDGWVEKTSWGALPEPFKFDETDDADHYSVGFFAQAPSPFPQHIQPMFASGVAWQFRNDYRSIEPSDWYGQSTINHWAVIPDFTVALQPW